MWTMSAHLRMSPSFILLELASEKFALNPPVENLERSEQEARFVNPQSVRNEPVCVAADLVAQSSVPCRDSSKAGDDFSRPTESAAITVDEADEYVNVVGSTTLMTCDVKPKGFTFRESVSHAFPRDSFEVNDTSGLPLC